MRTHGAEEGASFFFSVLSAGARPPTFKNDVGVLGHRVGDLRARRFEFAVGNPRRNAGTTRDRDVGAERFQFFDGLRSRRDPGFTRIGFTRYGNSHSRLPARP